MIADTVQQTETLSTAFAASQGDVSILIQSKTGLAISVSINAAAELDLIRAISKSDLDDTFYCSILDAFDDRDQLTLKNLIGLMLIVSDNPATSAVLEFIGIDKVNDWLARNG